MCDADNSMPSIYDFPDVSEAVVRAPQEQIEAEVASIVGLLARRGIHGGRVLELACGTCPHGMLLAQQGFEVVGIDLSRPALAVAAERAAATGLPVETRLADIVDFDLGGEPFDCAIFMAETFPLIAQYDDLVRHFASVRKHLRPGGIYVVDVDAHRHGVRAEYAVWGENTIPLPDGRVEIWHEDFPGDWVLGTSHLVMHCRIFRGDSMVETREDWHIRVDSPWHLELLLKTLPGWSLAGFYSWRDLSTDIAPEEHYFMVVE
ncbi:MAG: class I SAM-dependent methyltransferase [Anaerolineae bacterium]